MKGFVFCGNTILPEILNMSVVAGISIVIILIARILLRNSPKKFSYLLWAVALFRLICPISINAPISLYKLFLVGTKPRESLIGKMLFVTMEKPERIVYEWSDSGIVEAVYVSGTTKLTENVGVVRELFGKQIHFSMENVLAMIAAVWLLGIVVIVIYTLIDYLILRKHLKEAVPIGDNVYLADHITSPFVIGGRKPRIYLLSSLSKLDQEQVILHEKYHIGRADHVIRLMAYIALVIHWFNPLVWVAYILSGQDMEMSCDEAVLKGMGRDDRAKYAETLLKVAIGKKRHTVVTVAFGENCVKDRIRNLARTQKQSFVLGAGAVLLCMTVLITCALNPGAGFREIKRSHATYTEEELVFLKDAFAELLVGGKKEEELRPIVERCSEIINKTEVDSIGVTEFMKSREWFYIYYQSAKTREIRYSAEELQEQYPAAGVLLEAEREYQEKYGKMPVVKSGRGEEVDRMMQNFQ